MALINPYCTVAQVQSELRNTDSALTTQLENAINEASRWIDEYKGRDYFLHDHSSSGLVIPQYRPDLIIGASLFLPYTPIITITSVTTTIGGVAEAWVLDTDHVVDTELGRLIAIDGGWGLYLLTDKVTIVGQFGYAQASAAAVPSTIPLHITRACIGLAAAWSGHNQKEVVGLDGAKEQVVDKKIPKDVLTILGSRRIIT